jgi:serine/threonine protein kinase
LTAVFQTKETRLTDKNYLGEGGEGVIYLKDGLIYKIYHEKNDIITAQKLAELSVLKRINIITPLGHVYNSRGLPIGYAMNFVQNTSPLARLFTTSFRNRNNITPEMATKLVEKMAETIHYIHQNGIIIVDGNEFNYLVDGTTFIIPYFIDVDSYQTKSFPAKVIMPSIRDWQSKIFSPLTDWYSFAIVATQIFVGIHPFKGNHPNYPKNDLKARQLANVSIFNKEVSTPPATRDYGLIPSEYMNWFVDVFEKGKRTPPPTIVGKIITKAQLVIETGKDKFVIEKIFDADSTITGCGWTFGNRIMFSEKSSYINSHNKPLPSKSAGVIYFDNTAYLIDVKKGKLLVSNYNNGQVLSDSIIADRKLIVDNRIYVINDDKLMEIKFKGISGKIFITTGNVWSILPNSTHVFREIIYSDVLGKPYFYIPFKEDACSIVQIPELVKHKIIDAKYENGICILLTFVKNLYNRVVIKFNPDFQTYAFEMESDVIPSGINFVSLPNNIYMHYTGEGEVVIGSRFKPEKKIFSDIKFDNDITLCHNGLEVYYYSENTLYKIKVK